MTGERGRFVKRINEPHRQVEMVSPAPGGDVYKMVVWLPVRTNVVVGARLSLLDDEAGRVWTIIQCYPGVVLPYGALKNDWKVGGLT